MKTLTIHLTLTPGVCRWCRCTYDRPCANGCGWADRGHTLCTECVPLDFAMHSARGRRELAELVQQWPRVVTSVVTPNVPRGQVSEATSRSSQKV